MIKIIISGLITILIIYVRIWLINSVFVDKKIKINLTLKIFLNGSFIVINLFVYKYLLIYLGFENIYFAKILDLKNIIIFVIYCIFFIIFNSLLYKNISRKNIWQSIVVGLILFLMIGYGGYIIGISIILMYYFLAAYAEEIMKFIAGENIFSKEGKNNSDLIFFCILIGLAFAIMENIFYLGFNIFNKEVNLIGLSLGRGFISSMLHVITTGIVAYVTMKGLNKKINIGTNWMQSRFMGFVFIGIILGFAIHSIYNLSLFYNWKFISIPIIVLGYFIFSFLMFKSDKIYLRNVKLGIGD